MLRSTKWMIGDESVSPCGPENATAGCTRSSPQRLAPLRNSAPWADLPKEAPHPHRTSRPPTPARGPRAEQRPGAPPAEGGPPPPPHQPPADIVIDRDQVPRSRRGRDGLADLGGEFGRHSLVSVDLDDPVGAGGVDAGVRARGLALP